tara:strand:+ start:2047 stop:2418 length:372 start_codon:yes stop_codon:yes gene_type:complete
MFAITFEIVIGSWKNTVAMINTQMKLKDIIGKIVDNFPSLKAKIIKTEAEPYKMKPKINGMLVIMDKISNLMLLDANLNNIWPAAVSKVQINIKMIPFLRDLSLPELLIEVELMSLLPWLFFG